MPRQAVVRQFEPRRRGVDEDVRARPDARIVIEQSEPNRHLVPVGPVAAEEARAAFHAEDLRLRRGIGSVDVEQLLAAQEPEPLLRDTSLRQPERTGMLAAARAMAMDGDPERRRRLERHAAAKTAPAHRLGHGDSLESGLHFRTMSRTAWELLFMMLVLKLPIVYLCVVVYWAIKA